MTQMLSTLRRTSFALSKRAGLTGAIGDSAWRQERLLILCYHGISIADEHRWHPGLYISADMLASRFEMLRRANANVLPLDEAIERLYANDLPPRAVALTFDDGYQDFLLKAYPLLQRYGYPATVYLPTLRVLKNAPIPHLFLAYLLWTSRDRKLDARGIAGLGEVYELASAATRQAVIASLLKHFEREKFRADDKDAAARAITGRLGFDYDAIRESGLLRLLTAEQVRMLSDAGVAFELHTHRHRTPEDPELFRKELADNRGYLEQMTGKPARHFCYPSGVYRTSYLDILKEEGVRSATTCDPDLAGRSSNVFLLPRFVDTTWVGDLEFESWVTGAACWLPRRTRRAHAQVH